MIEDNFLDIESFHTIQTKLLSTEVHWHYQDFLGVSNERYEPYKKLQDQNSQFYFSHAFYEGYAWCSPFAEILEPLLLKIKPISILMIRANLTTRTNKIIEGSFHSDLKGFIPDEDKLKQWTTAIFYLNNTDGYTKLSDGTIIESKSNRLLTMSSDTEHLGATCTDQKRRVVINLNYYK
mgnify:CR=1 FL=1|jgi:hypothetical protein|tara:strand:+ start:821 stop:1357 length:537 start_codon:yes stop_codon:yes gene_type:complete